MRHTHSCKYSRHKSHTQQQLGTKNHAIDDEHSLIRHTMALWKYSTSALYVTSYREGALRLSGCITLALLGLLAGGLFVLYEMVLINVEDADFRDMLFDFRVTGAGIRAQQQRFEAARVCCHSDPALGYTCNNWNQVECPPMLQFTCTNVGSDDCNLRRSVIYGAAGLDPSGAPTDCSRAGKALIQVMQGASAGPLGVANYGGAGMLSLPADARLIDKQAVQDYVDAAIAKFSDELYRSPSKPLGAGALLLDGAPLSFQIQQTQAQGDTNNFGWPPELWPWPQGGGSCPNTGWPSETYLTGTASTTLAAYFEDSPPVVSITLLNSSMSVPQYSWTAEGGTLVLQALTQVEVQVALAAPMDGCNAWWIHSLDPVYGSQLWAGRQEDAAALANGAWVSKKQAVAVNVHDVAAPRPLALPAYRGEIYIFVAICCGGIFFFSGCIVILSFLVITVNKQLSRPIPLFYRWMRRFRGW